jgi:integrase
MRSKLTPPVPEQLSRFALLLGAGLRREEIVSLEIGHVQQREGRWVIADLIGKRKRIRTVPIPGWAKVAIDQWTGVAGITEGRLFRSVDKAGRVTGETLSAQAIYLIVTARRAENICEAGA